MKKIAAFLITLTLAVLCAACGGSTRYKVTFEPNGGDGMAFTQTVEDGMCASEPEEPVRDGYDFTGWYADASGTGEPYSFEEPVHGPFTLYAGWEARPQAVSVGTVAEFFAMTDGYYRLTADLDFSDKPYTPVGTETAPFMGRLDGAGHTLRGVRIAQPLAGVFGCLSGRVENLTVEDAEIDIEADGGTVQAGILAGRLWGGEIVGCHVSGRIAAANADARLSVFLGSVAGRSTDGLIKGCSGSATISGMNIATVYAGGLVGYNGGEGYKKAQVVSSRFLGNVSAAAEGEKGSAYAGGVAGYNAGAVDGCYASAGSVSGSTGNYYCFAGGLVGDNNGGYVENSFSALDVEAETKGGNTFLGGVVGHNFLDFRFENSFGWDGQRLTLRVLSEGSSARHERLQAPLLSAEEFSSAERQAQIFGDGFELNDGNYPTPAGGEKVAVSLTPPEGTVGAPLPVSDAQGLAAMDPFKAYRLQNDIALEGDWTALGTYEAPFYGSLDGNGYKISGLRFNAGGSYLGLFGYFGGRVEHLRVAAAATVSGSEHPLYAGGLVAFNAGGYISRCAADVDFTLTAASVQGGGIVGYNDGGIAEACSATGKLTVNATTPSAVAGGIAGNNDGGYLLRSESLVTLTVRGRDVCYAGGIAGKNQGTVADCRVLGGITAGVTEDVAASRVIAGGIAGENRGEVRNSYHTAVLTAENRAAVVAAGGVVGANYADVRNCYFLRDGERYGVAFSERATEAFRCEREDLKTLAEKLGGAFRDDADEGMPVLAWQEETV